MVEKFFLGVVLALLYSELTGIVPGGIIVPAFVATTLDKPCRSLLTLGVALITMAIYRLASKYFLLYGRRRFVFLLLLGACLSELSFYLGRIYFFPQTSGFVLPEVRVIGLIIPGLLASNLERQKFWPTLASFITVTVMAYFLGKLIG
ncbi:MAG: poly-gamma-glutamate biosynthesis protein PgsC [Candidatus Aminicenantes bacterium]|nr:poly-gamma-glutamate biosynthesis protein PgsC [Candidatus Aminicenantes bacterium]